MSTKHCDPLNPQKHTEEEEPARQTGELSWVSTSQTSQGLLSTHGPNFYMNELLAAPTAEPRDLLPKKSSAKDPTTLLPGSPSPALACLSPQSRLLSRLPGLATEQQA